MDRCEVETADGLAVSADATWCVGAQLRKSLALGSGCLWALALHDVHSAAAYCVL